MGEYPIDICDRCKVSHPVDEMHQEYINDTSGQSPTGYLVTFTCSDCSGIVGDCRAAGPASSASLASRSREVRQSDHPLRLLNRKEKP